MKSTTCPRPPRARLHRILRSARRGGLFGGLLGGLLLATATACSDIATEPGPSNPAPNDVVLDWSLQAHDVMLAHDDYANGLSAVRIFSMMHAAQHDALNAIEPVFEAYTWAGSRPGGDLVAAAAAAAHHVLSTLFPDQLETLDARLASSLEAVAEGEARDLGIATGLEAAAAILALRADDGSDTPLVGDYVPGAGPGRYQFTPPFPFAALPGWRYVLPFALGTADQFRSPPPPPLWSELYARDLNEVREVGRRDSAVRTVEEGRYAMFWEEFSDIGWNRIARVVSADLRSDLHTTARLFALLNMAMSDAYVAGWDAKYHYDLWRPLTAILAADTDGNADTVSDPTWEPLLVTPPVQDYPSTHSALGNAAAAVLAHVFGDDTPFTFTSVTGAPGYATRTFESFSQAADENADSRVMGGLHFRFACEAGQELGRKVGAWVIENVLGTR